MPFGLLFSPALRGLPGYAPIVGVDVDMRGVEGDARLVCANLFAFACDDVDIVAEELGAYDLVATYVLDPAHLDRQSVTVRKPREFRAHPDFHLTVQRAIGRTQIKSRAVDIGL